MLKELLTIYFIFLRMGAVTFGGGYAMLPILRRDIVQTQKWMDEETIMDFYAISQGLPGIIAINVSVFIGYKQRKVPGAIAAALGMVSPCIIIISIISFFLAGFQDNPIVQHALSAISVCVVALILDAVIAMWKKGVKDVIGFIIFLIMFILNMFTGISPIILIIVCALSGVGINGTKRKLGKEGDK